MQIKMLIISLIFHNFRALVWGFSWNFSFFVSNVRPAHKKVNNGEREKSNLGKHFRVEFTVQLLIMGIREIKTKRMKSIFHDFHN